MRIDDVLTDALREEADACEVDLTRMWADTRDRLAEEAAPRRHRPPMLAAAAALVLVGGGAAVTGLLQSGDDAPAPAGSAEGDVADEFSCPEQVVHDWTRPATVVDDHFVASLRGGLASWANTYDVPLYELAVEGDRAVASFGNADGSLALRSEFRREGESWVALRSDVCTGEDSSVAVPLDDPLALGEHGGSPLPAPSSAGSTPILVDHRAYYDHVGVVRPRSLYVGGARSGLRISSVFEDGVGSMLVRPGMRPVDVSALFLPDDDPSWRVQPYGMWALYDPDGRVEILLANRGNMLVGGEEITSDAWPGTLHVVVAPFEEVTNLTVTPLKQVSRAYSPEQLRGYRADLHKE